MGVRSEEYRAEARRLEQHAEAASDDNAERTLRNAAQRLREIADEVERHELD